MSEQFTGYESVTYCGGSDTTAIGDQLSSAAGS
jgi:hypothetical protein